MTCQSATVYQDILVQRLQSLIPHDSPHVNVRKQTRFKYSSEDTHYLELDVWFPKLNICFEFQDNYHYLTTWYSQQSLLQIQHNDDIKKDKIQRTGMSLVVIPCWWDGNIGSLQSTIHFYLPDICEISVANPIPLCPPKDFYQASVEIPNIGELMYASFPLNQDSLLLEKWWIGEKYDGLRFCWNPLERKLFTRYANEIQVLPSYYSSLPSIVIDGEMWFGRGSFSLTTMLVKSMIQFVPWDLVRLNAFDCPDTAKPFEDRYERLVSSVSPANPCVVVVSRYLSFDATQDTIVQNIVQQEGEGIIMRKEGSPYEHGRSSSLIKMKSIYGDSEGVVVGIRQKSVYLQLSNGITFRVPPENVNVRNLSVGDVVSFSYESHTRKNIVVNPKINRVRNDIPWQSTNLQDYQLEQNSLAGENLGTMRILLEDFAAKRSLDPLLPRTWYDLTASEFVHDKRVRTVLRKFGSYINAITSLFPEIRFDRNQFKDMMSSVRRRRAYFESYAKKNGFDPLNPEHWYSHRTKMLPIKETLQAIYYHNSSIAQALVDLFPEIGLEKPKLMYSGAIYKRPNRRKFFEKYAKLHGFDPLNPVNWYMQPKNRILATKGVRGVLWYHGNSIAQALLDLFPEIGLEKEKLDRFLWKKINRRLFFEKYAKSKGFDPLNSENWYHQSKNKIKALKGATSVLWYHSNSVSKALLDLFPEIGLDKLRLKSTILWNAVNRRKFFEDFAKSHAFDPLLASNWYSHSQKHIAQQKGSARVLWYHSNNGAKALIELFPEVAFDKAKLAYSMALRQPKLG
eukprot:Phypoly_transcript_02276.p1 GENE.Phypoly_transcript_02276~~Phypoly_transcript_02276.p1  ORF type:complete len:794 (+),score=74.23 Phypoly_transcript_02276:119-2500(+)